MGRTFTATDWPKIRAEWQARSGEYGLPERRAGSVVIGTFNIREFGDPDKRSPEAFDFLVSTCRSFDLLSIQEVGDNLAAIRRLKAALGEDFGMVVSDVTGVYPGSSGNAERLAFLFDWRRIERTELASDITIDRSRVYETLVRHHDEMEPRLRNYQGKISDLDLGVFVTFIRTPLCASFRIRARGEAEPIEFLAVSAHLLYGKDGNKIERKLEFDALIEWLCIRAKQVDRTYHKNFLLLGDCNLDFAAVNLMREAIDAELMRLNTTVLKSRKAAKVNFPLLSSHPDRGYMRTNARMDETYDQIALFHHDARLPEASGNDTAGRGGPDGYDYGVFRFTDLIARALFQRDFAQLAAAEQSYIIDRCQWDISDHMPAWIRLPIP